MDNTLRQQLRERRHKRARERMEASHVEFCSSCGVAIDRTGRRDMSECHKCARGTTRREHEAMP